MYMETNEYVNRMWTDERYRIEVTECEERQGDGASRIGGWLIPREPAQNHLPLVNIPFRISLPPGLADMDLHWYMSVMYNRLRARKSLLEGLDFAPELTPVTVQAAVNWAGVGVVLGGLLAAGAVCNSWK